MIKKTIILFTLMFVLSVPTVLVNAGFGPKPARGEFIEIEVDLITPVVEIGGVFIADITITNLSNLDIDPDKTEFNGVIDSVDWPLEINDDGREVDTLIKPYESMTIRVESIVNFENVDYYKNGDKFYVDIKPYVNFNTVDENNYIWHYEICDYVLTLEIDNLNDGSDFIDLKWLDDRESLYCFRIHDYYEGGVSHEGEECKGVVYYNLSYTNLSDKIINDLKPGQEIIVKDKFYITSDYYYLSLETHRKFTYNVLFEVDDKYYCVDASKEYKFELLQLPKLAVEIIPTKLTDGEHNINSLLKFKNIDSKTIDSLMIVAGVNNDDIIYNFDDLYLITDLKQGEECYLEFDVYDTEGSTHLMIGYYLDDIFYYWHVEYPYPLLEQYYSNEVVYDGEFLLHFDFEEYVKKFDENQNPQITATPLNEVTATPRSASTPTPTNNETPKPTPSPKVTITNRQNPMLFAYIVIGVLMAGAVVAIILSLKNIVKNNKKE